MTRRIEPICQTAALPIATLHRACFADDPWEVDAIKQVMRMPGFFGRTAWVDDDLAGFALALDLGGECEILSLGILAEWRRNGIGSALLDSICHEATRRGAGWVVLETAADNEAACAFYARHGFTVVGRRRNYYKQAGRSADALILRAALPSAPTAI
jgi:[ribosomal protein S18]-alanine N-acetyltransferase